MGQRSQIYVRCNGKFIIANYYQWNYGERMISRAKYGIEQLLYYIKNDYTFAFENFSEITKISRIFDVNFDYRDVVVSTNIFDDIAHYAPYQMELEFANKSNDELIESKEFNDFIQKDLFNQDNNDGMLLIDINFEAPKGESKLKYCFTDYDKSAPMSAEQYLSWNIPSWKENLDEDEVKFTEENIDFLKFADGIDLMSKSEFENYFQNVDFDKNLVFGRNIRRY